MPHHHMPHLIRMYHPQHPCAPLVPLPPKPRNRPRIHIQPARLVHEMDNREPRAQGVRGVQGAGPEGSVDGEGPVRCAERVQTGEEEGEVFGFVEGDFGEVGEELVREGFVGGAEAGDGVPSVWCVVRVRCWVLGVGW